MPNTLTSIFVSSPATEPVEAPHPNTGVYVTGTQATAGGPWTVTHTLVTKTTTPLTMVGRLKNFPAVTVAVTATGGPNAGNIFNNVPAAPLGISATGTSTGINVTASTSPNSLANRILSSDTAAGTFTTLYTGTTSSYPHPLTAGAVKYYKYQYVGSGYNDDSLVSAIFSSMAGGAGTFESVVFGDSLSGQVPTDYGISGRLPSWYQIMQTSQGSGYANDSGNFALAGNDYLTQTSPINAAARNTAYPKGLAFIWLGINDLGRGITAPALFARAITAKNTLVGKGFDVAIATLTDYQNNAYAGQSTILSVNQERAVFNQLLREGYVANGFSVLVDLESDARVGPYGVALNNTTSFVDGLHMNQAGRTIIAGMQQQAFALYKTATVGRIAGQAAATPPVAPVISSFPASATVGSTLTLTGTGFTAAYGVSVSGVNVGAFTITGDTQISFTVPSAATGRIRVAAPGAITTAATDLTIAAAVAVLAQQTAFTYSAAGWSADNSNTVYNGGTGRYTQTAGSYYEFTTPASVRIIRVYAPTSGGTTANSSVTIDGGTPVTVNQSLTPPAGVSYNQSAVVYQSPALVAGVHVIRVTANDATLMFADAIDTLT